MSDQIKEIKEKLDIVTIADEYLSPLRHSGKNYFALCPFHNEKTPSFSINQDLQLYKCFGCGESGDVLSLLMKLENVDFRGALEIAAKKAGIELKKFYSPEQEKHRKDLHRLFEGNKLVAEYYHYILTKHNQGEYGRTYCKKRNLSKSSIETFCIGFAPDSFENVKQFLIKKKYHIDDLVKSGFLAQKGSKTYDKFRNRLMFPIYNNSGEIVGFSGRALSDDQQPKYLNSPETMAFRKSNELYGLYQAKDAIRKEDSAIILEGQIDVISSHQADVKHIIAPLGTAITKEQMKLIGRFTKNITFCLDTDLAAEKALLRSIPLAHEAGLNVQAISITSGKDVDELVQKHPQEWKQLAKKPEHIIDHLMNRLQNRLNISDPVAKNELSLVLLPLISSLDSAIERDAYLKKLALLIDIDEQALREQISEMALKKDYFRPLTKSLSVKKNSSPRSQYLAAFILQNFDYFKQSKKQSLVQKLYKDSTYFNLMSTLLKLDTLDQKKFLDSLNEIEKNICLHLFMMNVSHPKTNLLFMEEFSQLVDELEQNEIKKDLRTIRKKLKTQSLTEQEQEDLLGQIQKLSKRRGAITLKDSQR